MNQTLPPRQRRHPINREMSLDETCVLLAEGNPKVLKFLKMVAMTNHRLLLDLDDMNMRGMQILAILHFCDGLFPKFNAMVTTRDDGMIAWVNEQLPHLRAVKRGGAPR